MVEDEDMLRDLICETLGMHKYKVLEERVMVLKPCGSGTSIKSHWICC